MKGTLYNISIAILALVATACQGQTKYELPAPLKDRAEVILQRKGYTTAKNGRYPPTQNGDIRSLF